MAGGGGVGPPPYSYSPWRWRLRDLALVLWCRGVVRVGRAVGGELVACRDGAVACCVRAACLACDAKRVMSGGEPIGSVVCWRVGGMRGAVARIWKVSCGKRTKMIIIGAGLEHS